jgi:hypothetical protein
VHTLDELESAMVDLGHRDRPVVIEVSLDPEVIAASLGLYHRWVHRVDPE